MRTDKRINAAYFRLSLADGDIVFEEGNGKRESNSIASQRLCIHEYARAYLQLEEPLVEFVDDGYTGTNFERPGFRRLLQEIMAGNVQTLFIKDLSRLGRNYIEVGYYLEKYFPFYHVRVILVNDGYDSGEGSGEIPGLDLVIKNLINEWYSRDISRKIKSVVDMKKYDGEYVYGAVPFGYVKGKEKNTIEIDPPAAEVVKSIFDLACGGKTITQIARELNERKVITPSVYMAQIRKNYKIREFWTYESVRNIMTNRIYTGDTEVFKSHVVQVGSDRVKQIPPRERPVIENTHPAIISREMYFEARNVIKHKGETKKHGKGDILSGYLVCGCCGNRLIKGKDGNKKYYCASSRYAGDKDCSQVKVPADKVKTALLHAIRMQLDIAGISVTEAIRGQKVSYRQQELDRELKRISNRLDSWMDESLALYEEYITGKIDKILYMKKKEQLITDKKALEQQKDELEAQRAKNNLQKEKINLHNQYQKKYGAFDTLNDVMMKEFIDRVTIMPGGEMQIKWNFKENKLLALADYNRT